SARPRPPAEAPSRSPRHATLSTGVDRPVRCCSAFTDATPAPAAGTSTTLHSPAQDPSRRVAELGPNRGPPQASLRTTGGRCRSDVGTGRHRPHGRLCVHRVVHLVYTG